MKLFETEIKPPRIMLASVDIGEYDVDNSLLELEELTNTAGGEVVIKVTQKRPSYDKATCVGQGRLEEMATLCESNEVDQIIFDQELTATQIRNIEDVTNTHTIDRTMLILDIFAGRATTKEGRLQVELAQNKYRLPRLAGMGIKLSRLGGGIGTRGPGESKLETDKRHIRTRIGNLSAELKEIEKRREFSRAKRKKDGTLICTIVGYTNAGKSTLLNRLTDAGVLVEDKLFATLETTSRAIELPDGRSVMLIDTVGFVSRLPHHIVEAFKSTLEEASSADVILHICDASNENCSEQAEVTLKLLSELGCKDIPVITVFNKCDISPYIDDISLDSSSNNDSNSGSESIVKISAKTGEGIESLLNAISKALPETSHKAKLILPFDKAGLLNKIRIDGKVFSEEYTEAGIECDVLVDNKIWYLVSEYKI